MPDTTHIQVPLAEWGDWLDLSGSSGSRPDLVRQCGSIFRGIAQVNPRGWRVMVNGVLVDKGPEVGEGGAEGQAKADECLRALDDESTRAEAIRRIAHASALDDTPDIEGLDHIPTENLLAAAALLEGGELWADCETCGTGGAIWPRAAPGDTIRARFDTVATGGLEEDLQLGCKGCGHEWSQTLPAGENTVTAAPCPACGAGPLVVMATTRRVPSAFYGATQDHETRSP